MDNKNQWSKFVFYAVLLFMLAALGLYTYLGSFTRYMADDYCTAAALRNGGFWNAQTYWWQNWSGRYSFTFLVSFVELFGLRIVPILPAMILLLWWLSFIWAFHPLLRDWQISNYIAVSVFLASITLWLTYQSTIDYPQIVFWQTGILTYPPSPILFLLGTGMAVRRSYSPAVIRWWELIFWFLFAFIAGGFSETGAVIQIALLGTFFVLVHWIGIEKKRIFSPILLGTLLGSIFSFLVIALAPGNLARSGGFQNIPPLVPAVLGSFAETLLFFPNLITTHTFTLALGFGAGVFLGTYYIPNEIRLENRMVGKYFLVSIVIAFVGIWSGIAPAYILRGGIPPERVLLFSYFLINCLVMYWGTLGPLLLRRNLPTNVHGFQGLISAAFLLFLLAWGVAPVIRSQIQLIPVLKQYSEVWDLRHLSMVSASQAGESIIVVDDLTHLDTLRKLSARLWLAGDFETDADNWINQCAARYYGVEQVIAK